MYTPKAETPASLAAIIGIEKRVLKNRIEDLPLAYHKQKEQHPRRQIIMPSDVKLIVEYLAPELLTAKENR